MIYSEILRDKKQLSERVATLLAESNKRKKHP